MSRGPQRRGERKRWAPAPLPRRPPTSFKSGRSRELRKSVQVRFSLMSEFTLPLHIYEYPNLMNFRSYSPLPLYFAFSLSGGGLEPKRFIEIIPEELEELQQESRDRKATASRQENPILRFLLYVRAHPLLYQCISECFGTFILTWIVTCNIAGAVIANSEGGLWDVAIVCGLGLMLAIFCTAAISGLFLSLSLSLSLSTLLLFFFFLSYDDLFTLLFTYTYTHIRIHTQPQVDISTPRSRSHSPSCGRRISLSRNSFRTSSLSSWVPSSQGC